MHTSSSFLGSIPSKGVVKWKPTRGEQRIGPVTSTAPRVQMTERSSKQILALWQYGVRSTYLPMRRLCDSLSASPVFGGQDKTPSLSVSYQRPSSCALLYAQHVDRSISICRQETFPEAPTTGPVRFCLWTVDPDRKSSSN